MSKQLNITERIKTLEDAIKELGADNALVKEYEAAKNISLSPDVVAYLKLRIITAALNEGWVPTFSRGEYRYSPYFYIYSKEEVEAMSEGRKKGLCLGFGAASAGLDCGLACAYSNDAWSFAHSVFGSRLAYKSSDLAEYSGRQFASIWADYIIINKK